MKYDTRFIAQNLTYEGGPQGKLISPVNIGHFNSELYLQLHIGTVDEEFFHS